jgi:hypothetical protein
LVSSTQYNSNYPLLHLLGEIRNQIYHYVIGGHEAASIYREENTNYMELEVSLYNEAGETERCWADLFNLSHVCKELNQKTKVLPYTHTVFQARPGTEFGVLLSLLKEDKMKLIILFRSVSNTTTTSIVGSTRLQFWMDCTTVLARRPLCLVLLLVQARRAW